MKYFEFVLVLFVISLGVMMGQTTPPPKKHIKLNTTALPPPIEVKPVLPKHNKTHRRDLKPVLISSINEVLDELDQEYNITYMAELINVTEQEHWQKVMKDVEGCQEDECGLFNNMFRYFTEIKSLLISNKDI